ncbi:MAG: sigma-70 family RNA polymerase sigma factor [Clostridiales bacterium]|nr:sigma-70 family RNA polymerase sigma factor [Clostridiales bacterium]
MFVSILKTRADREDAAQSPPRIAETIFTRYGDAMFRAAYDVLREDWAAEDAVMDALEHICVHEEEFASLPERNARRLALRVVRNAALDRWRRRNRRAEHELPAGKAFSEIPDGEPAPTDEDFGSLEEAVAALPDVCREAVRLRYGDGFTNREIARMLEIPESTVATRLARARELLKRAAEAGREE